MKKVLLGIILFATLAPASIAQVKKGGQEVVAPNCYQKYAAVFEKRGAKHVEDGVHDDIIITIRQGINADCFYGRVKVDQGKISKMEFKFEDGTFEFLDKRYKQRFDGTIQNGMSRSQVTEDDEIINVLFVKHIKPKKKEYMKAPDPNFDF